MGGLRGLSTTQREFDVLDAASAWAQAKEELLEAKVSRKNAEVRGMCSGTQTHTDPNGTFRIECRLAGRPNPAVGYNPVWCSSCERWNRATLVVEKAQRQLKKAEKALTAAIKAWRRT